MSANTRVLGLMSGTSVDAIDAAVIDIGPAGLETGTLTVVDHREVPWDDALRRRILACLPPARIDVGEVCALEQAIGQAFAAVAREVQAEVDGIELVACHGQTVFHWVADSGPDRGRALGTLQWGEPAWIAEATGLPVVSNLRAADIAAGGQGAPLVPVLDVMLCGDRPTAVINLGGIANVTVVRDGRAVVAGDTGPANCLIDALVQRATGQPFDADGALAAAGRVDEALLARLLDHPYLGLPMPKSTGREVFSLAWFDQVVAEVHPDERTRPGLPDLLATGVAFTCRTLLDQLPDDLERLVVSGGGAHHPGIMARLRDHADWQVVSPDERGVPADAKEAVLIALLGWLSVTGRPGVATDATGRPLTGAREARVLGTVTLSARRGGGPSSPDGSSGRRGPALPG
ncbi:anhydro-N-acetylmuramic acid kinase [Aestuariimicrobium soli]|uniref:anhydro-N-acetylmuramic acid kinase n=1 Tax=Aestuariimicrobium soli TaxID=2035834 RepID=UPI003EBC362F